MSEPERINAVLRTALERIRSFPVHSEPVGSAYAMQDIAHDALSSIQSSQCPGCQSNAGLPVADSVERATGGVTAGETAQSFGRESLPDASNRTAMQGLKGEPPSRYHIKEFARGRWHVIGPSGLPLYDNEPHGNDKPLIFKDEDEALEYAGRCEMSDEGETI